MAGTAAPGFNETWKQLPWVTRHVGAVTIALFILYTLQPRLAMFALRIPNAPRWQVWRYLLSPFSYLGDPINGLISVFSFCKQLYYLEESCFRSRGRTLYYLLWLVVGFNIFASFISGYGFLTGVVSAITWTVSQQRPYDMVSLIVIPLQQCYLPLATLGLTFLLTGGDLQALYVPAWGIVVAHSYLFFTELLPNAGGPSVLRETPSFLRTFDRRDQNAQKEKTYGRAHRLG